MTKNRKEKRKIDRLKQRILDALKDKAELSNNRGIFISTKFKLSKKDRKRSGWRTPQLDQKGKFSEMIANAEEPAEEYDDWFDSRDGWRYGSDRTHLFKSGRGCSHMSPEEIKGYNKKIKKQIAIRKAKKQRFMYGSLN